MGRVLLIVLDGCGAGAAPDADRYGTSDTLANTLSHVASAAGGLDLPNLEALGFGNITQMLGVVECPDAKSIWGRLTERNAGKDTVAGHWELMGIPLLEPFPTYPSGIPCDIQGLVRTFTGKQSLCNVPMSGTDAIREFGDEHCATGAPIVYTSADSVLQVAVHEATFGLENTLSRAGLCSRYHCQGWHPGRADRSDHRAVPSEGDIYPESNHEEC